MSQNELRLNGLAEFRDALRHLPADLTTEASDIVGSTADEAKRQIVDQYPTVTGKLKEKVKVTHDTLGFSASATVTSGAKHAHLYEFGTQVRRTSIGANRGAMPPRPTFIPVVTRMRRAMQAKLIDFVKRAGFQVTGAG